MQSEPSHRARGGPCWKVKLHVHTTDDLALLFLEILTHLQETCKAVFMTTLHNSKQL